jgi:hypothetical protein
LRYCFPKSRVLDGVNFTLPEITTASDVPGAIGAVLKAMGEGQLSPSDAQAIVASLEALSRSLIYDGHEQRLAALEAFLAGEGRSPCQRPGSWAFGELTVRPAPCRRGELQVSKDDPVVEAAKRFAYYSEEARRAKGELRKLLDGDAPNPRRPSARLSGHGGRRQIPAQARAAKAANAEEEDKKVVALLKEATSPLRQTEIALQLKQPSSSVGNRLSRLERRGLIVRDANRRWVAIPSSESASLGSGP